MLSCYLHVQSGMFRGAPLFNQDIGNWNVSNGKYFVSIVMKINIAMNILTAYFTYDLLSLTIIYFMERITCSKEPRQHLIKIFVGGI